MRQIHRIAIILSMILLAMASTAIAEKRLALVIGNGAYQHVRPLRNSTNDARDLADALKSLGFEVILRVDADRQIMKEAVDKFWKALGHADVGLLYYAGHGVQYQNENYLLPTNARIALDKDIPEESVSAGSVLNRMEDANKGLNIVILDACRTNLARSSSRDLTQGLAQMPSPKGSLIVFATAPNEEAFDGSAGRNGLFTSHLLRHIRTPGLKIEELINLVRIGVAEESARDKSVYRKQQIPWASSSIMGDFFFAGSQVRPLAPPAGDFNPKQPTDPGPVIFEDISSKAAALTKARAQLEENTRARWNSWQSSMQSAVSKAQVLEQDQQVNAADKAEAWLRIAKAYTEKNPYSDEDTKLRTTMKAQAEYWAAEVGKENAAKAKEEETNQAEAERRREEAQVIARQKLEAEGAATASAVEAPVAPGVSGTQAQAENAELKGNGQGRSFLPPSALAGIIVIGGFCVMLGLRRLGFGLCYATVLGAVFGPFLVSALSTMPKILSAIALVFVFLALIGVVFGRATMGRVGEGLLLDLVRGIATVPIRLLGGIFRVFRA